MSKLDTRDLLDYEPIAGAHVLSVYLQTHSIESLTVFETRLKEIGRQFEEAVEQHEFDECVSRVRRFLSRCLVRGESLAIFCSSAGSLWVRQVGVPLPNDVRWDKEPYWKPLIEAIDEFEPYGVITLEKFKVHILSVSLGEIHEHAILERTTDDLDAFLNKAISATQELMATECPNRLILAGDRDVRIEFLRLAPSGLRQSVIGSIGIPADASLQHILKVTQEIERYAERRFESKRVAELVSLAARHKKVAVGLEQTLDALNRNCAAALIYSEDFAAEGNHCDLCNGLFAADVTICPRCNTANRPVADLLASMVNRALSADASIEEVFGRAAINLDEDGGIGAFLRY